MKQIYLQICVILICGLLFPCAIYGQGKVQRPTKPRTHSLISEPDGYINGHGYVDLGLPSRTKWATCNVGASKPTEWGNFFSWGETRPKTEFTKENYFLTGDFSKEWFISHNVIDANDNITAMYDAANQNWGGNWRMPTKKQMEELADKTTQQWTKINGVWGKLVKSKKNGKTIFFPAACPGWENKKDFTGMYYIYWGATISHYASSEYNMAEVHSLWTSQLSFWCHCNAIVYSGNPIRPVSK